uniref:Uncharacterized protein n=2 Tax=Oryza TaxID=4527 RepID=A0A0E0CG16_9ORYZ
MSAAVSALRRALSSSSSAAKTSSSLRRLLPAAPLRRGVLSSQPRPSRRKDSIELSRSEEGRRLAGRFDEIEDAVHAILVRDIESYRASTMADQGFVERRLTSLGFTKGYTRDQALWLSKLVLAFFSSWVVGTGFAKIDDSLHQVNS